MQRNVLIPAIAAGLGLAGAIAYAAQSGAFAPFERPLASVKLDSPSSNAAPRTFAAAAAPRGSAGAAGALAKGPTVDEVGDIDSFGRNVVWLGLAQGDVNVSTDCASILAANPAALCSSIASTGTSTPFAFNDIARIKLAGKSTKSLFCHWLSPIVSASYANPATGPAVARIVYSPTLTVENPVLDDPALIDPTTGVPFGGRLQTGMSASEIIETVVHPGLPTQERQRDSAVCIAGFLTRRALSEQYGLTSTQVDRFFKEPTTVRLNVRGNVRMVEDLQLVLGLRIVGD